MTQRGDELLDRIAAAGFSLDGTGVPLLHPVREGAHMPPDLLAEVEAHRIDVMIAAGVRRARAEWEAQRPVRDEPPLPWDDMADSFARLDDARRHGTEDEIAVAERDAERAKDRVGAIGNLLLLFALSRCGGPVRKKMALLFDGLARSAWDKAKTAEERATWAAEQLEALRERIRELEGLVADLTPGVGEPALCR